MLVTSISEFRTEPGTYYEFPVRLGAGESSDVPASFNQSFHLASALDRSGAEATPAVWIAAAFDVAGPLDIPALRHAVGAFVRRHGALRTSFRSEDDRIARRIHGVEEVAVDVGAGTVIADGAAVSAHMRARFGILCHPSVSPSYSFAAVDRPGRTTILCGFDHAHVDAVSMTVAAEELSALYQARRNGRAAELQPVGDFVEYCDSESRTPVVAATDPRIRAWADFVRSCGGSTPSFPFDLGVTPGVPAAQATTITPVATAAQTERFEAGCRAQGAGMFAGVVAAMAQAAASIGGPEHFPLLFPLHTRREPRYAHAIGWFATNAPMTVEVGGSFADTLESARASFRAALPLGTVPIPRMLEALGDTFTRTRHDVFMVSYIDYRALPGADASDRHAHHISNVTTADDAQFWISRTDCGLSLRARFPDTARARNVVGEFVRAFVGVVSVVDPGAVSEESELTLVGPNA